MLFPSYWIEKILRIPTVTDQSNLEVVRFLEPLLQETGLKAKLFPEKEGGITFYNLVAESHPGKNAAWAFHTHLDTVDPGDPKLWTKTGGDPFRATVSGKKVYGLGSADVKLDFLCKLWAARQAKPWTKPFTLVGTYGEERGLVGAKKLLDQRAVQPRFAMVGEPSDLELVIAHKGHLIVSVDFPSSSTKGSLTKKFKGLAAHSSTPHLGKNAIERALAWALDQGYGILALEGGQSSNSIPQSCTLTYSKQAEPPPGPFATFFREFQKLQKQFRHPTDRLFSPSCTTLSINLAEVRKNRVSLTFDVRILPGLLVERVREQVTDVLAKLKLPFTILAEDPALMGKKTDPMVRLCSQALSATGTKPKVRTKASSTEAALYHQHGASAIVFGPGLSLGNVHRPNEYNLLDQMEAAIRFYQLLMELPDGT